MRIVVNGEETQLEERITVAGLVESLGLRARRVAIELNRDVLARERWQDTYVEDDDRIEIVQFVGGG